MTRLVWLLRWRTSQLALWTGLAFAAAALAFNWLGVRPLEKRIEALEQVRSMKREDRLAQMENELARQDNPRQQLASFYGYFARGDRLTDLLAKLYAVAGASGLEMQRAEYRMNSVRDRKLDRYQLSIPIRGSYAAIRAFITSALHELPTMSLDQVQLQRKAIDDNAVDAQINLTFHIAK